MKFVAKYFYLELAGMKIKYTRTKIFMLYSMGLFIHNEYAIQQSCDYTDHTTLDRDRDNGGNVPVKNYGYTKLW